MTQRYENEIDSIYAMKILEISENFIVYSSSIPVS